MKSFYPIDIMMSIYFPIFPGTRLPQSVIKTQADSLQLPRIPAGSREYTGNRGGALHILRDGAASDYLRERQVLSDFAIARMRVKYASSPAGTFAPSGSSTPILAAVPLMTVCTSLG